MFMPILKIIIYISIFCQIAYSCKNEPKKLEFIPIHIHFYKDTLDKTIDQSYIVRNYRDTESVYKSLDSFFCKTMYSKFGKYNSISMIFYKESKFTNLREIEKYDHIIDQYSTEHDKIYKLQIYIQNQEISRYRNFDGDEKLIGSFKCE